ncbi:URC4/urg3 family protein [Desertibaculum subflavum]|uniref:URC4/urg3 family protein n=1 Tax=Desertibaculum subflavum TaxID=2268458 RepID=UPI000E675AAE
MNAQPAVAQASPAAVAYLRSPKAIRERCGQVFAAAEAGRTPHFALDLKRLPMVADYVIATIRGNHPDFDIPYHSRWRHFTAGSVDRWKALAATRKGMLPIDLARMAIDLVVPSVLLDAGAGADWKWREPGLAPGSAAATGKVYARSEGLALASLELFRRGTLSDQEDDPYRSDAATLSQLATADVGSAFQVSDSNPLVGLEDRVDLLRRLGASLIANPTLFGVLEPRPGRLADAALAASREGRIAAATLFWMVMQMLGPVWPRRVALRGISLGDVGRHPAATATDATAGLVPFHKLSQWMTYSLLEPLEALGLTIDGLDQLTGLPEYRNGGLFIDLGVLVPKHAAVLGQPQAATSEVVVEWRALTVCLLDRVADAVRRTLGRNAVQMPLAKVLEGGTWAAGRQIARDRRPAGGPPIEVISDGTIF